MKFSLKVKLTLSYVLLSLFLVGTLLVVANYFLEKKFQNYRMEALEQKNLDYVDKVMAEFDENGVAPSKDILEKIGKSAILDGLVLMVNDKDGNQIICMSALDSQMCDNMIEQMKNHMASIYPNFHGEYIQKEYKMIREGEALGIVTLGFYGPFYYNDEDIQFLNVLNELFLIAAVVSLLIALTLGILMANRISTPIKKVIEKTRKIETGDYADRILLKSKTTEIKQLISSVNTLADTLECQQHSKKRMMKDYAHELRTPLATLQSNVEAMIDGIWEATPERLESCLEEILRLTRLLSDMENLTKMENDNLIVSKTSFDFALLIRQVISTYAFDLEDRKIKVEAILSPIMIYADKDKITQVLINLISNARNYSKENGIITIHLTKSEEQAVLSVSDNGIGISKTDLPHVFEYLYRTDLSRNRNSGGCGIGLSLVKAITEAHGGVIEVTSEEQKGSTFRVTLPIQ